MTAVHTILIPNLHTCLKVNDELCRRAGVQCNITSAYYPQSNGLDEQFNQTLQRQLLKFVNKEQKDWDVYLDAILFSYRVSRHDSTKQSPFVLVYGRQPRLPIEFNTKLASSENIGEECKGRNVEIGLEEHMHVCTLSAIH